MNTREQNIKFITVSFAPCRKMFRRTILQSLCCYSTFPAVLTERKEDGVNGHVVNTEKGMCNNISSNNDDLQTQKKDKHNV